MEVIQLEHKINHFECGGEINVLVKSRRVVHNIHEINGIFTLVQKQSCAISSVTRNSFRNSVIGKWRKSDLRMGLSRFRM